MNKNETGRTMADLMPEFMADVARRQQINESMPTDAEGVTLTWIDPDYFIAWEQLATPLQLIQWQIQIWDKRGATMDRLRIFTGIVCDHWGWRTWI